MGAADFDRLSEYQRECLRRTFRHQTSKEIARDLDRSKYAIDQAIERAVRILGATSRIEAAQALARYEGASDRIAGDPVDLAPTVPAASIPQPAVRTAGSRGPAFRLPLRRQGEDGNTLGIGARIAWLIILPIALAIGFGMLANGLKLVSDVVAAVVSRK